MMRCFESLTGKTSAEPQRLVRDKETPCTGEVCTHIYINISHTYIHKMTNTANSRCDGTLQQKIWKNFKVETVTTKYGVLE